MLIENASPGCLVLVADDALSSSVGLNFDFDMTLLVLASGLYRMMAKSDDGKSHACLP